MPTITINLGSLIAFFIPMFVMVPSYVMTVRLLSQRAKFVRNDSILLAANQRRRSSATQVGATNQIGRSQQANKLSNSSSSAASNRLRHKQLVGPTQSINSTTCRASNPDEDDDLDRRLVALTKTDSNSLGPNDFEAALRSLRRNEDETNDNDDEDEDDDDDEENDDEITEAVKQGQDSERRHLGKLRSRLSGPCSAFDRVFSPTRTRRQRAPKSAAGLITNQDQSRKRNQSSVHFWRGLLVGSESANQKSDESTKVEDDQLARSASISPLNGDTLRCFIDDDQNDDDDDGADEGEDDDDDIDETVNLTLGQLQPNSVGGSKLPPVTSCPILNQIKSRPLQLPPMMAMIDGSDRREHLVVANSKSCNLLNEADYLMGQVGDASFLAVACEGHEKEAKSVADKQIISGSTANSIGDLMKHVAMVG